MVGILSKIVRDNSRLPQIANALEELHSREIQIGIFGKNDSHLLMIANVNEFGVTIRPKTAKRLAVPLNKRAREHSPRAFSDLFPLKTNNGLYLVRNKGSNQLEFMYWLATEVTIPERAFIRGGFDANAKQISQKATQMLKKVILGHLDVDNYFNFMGEFIVSGLKQYMNSMRTPPNSSATVASKGSNNPLIDSGRLREAITFQVVRK